MERQSFSIENSPQSEQPEESTRAVDALWQHNPELFTHEALGLLLAISLRPRTVAEILSHVSDVGVVGSVLDSFTHNGMIEIVSPEGAAQREVSYILSPMGKEALPHIARRLYPLENEIGS